MFDNLTTRLQDIFKKLKSRGRLTASDVEAGLREVRLALLEADVNFRVVKDFIDSVRARATGHEVLESITPGQQVIKIVNDELTKLMGGTASRLAYAQKPPTKIMLAGLQGSGKTTAAAKLAHFMRKKERKRPFLIAADPYRPAGSEQLRVLAAEIGVPIFAGEAGPDPVAAIRQGLQQASSEGAEVVIVDTAGRLHIDAEMMAELQGVKEFLQPHQVLLVADAMTGQDAVNMAAAFDKDIGFDGVVLTKLDGDARGGAALSIKAVTGRPIKLVSLGEKVDSLDLFHPERMASRILGMGDVLSLIEKASTEVEEKKAKEMENRLMKLQFNLEDFLEQMHMLKKMGPMSEIIKMLPGAGGMGSLKGLKVEEGQLAKIEAIIQSMTVEERQNPGIINGSRRGRIAKGSGTTFAEVNDLLKRFGEAKRLLKGLVKGAKGKKGFPMLG